MQEMQWKGHGGEMSDWRNDDGEPMMTAAALRLEAELDALSAYDRAMDADYFPGDDVDCAVPCDSGDRDSVDGRAVCPWCGQDDGPWPDDPDELWQEATGGR